MSRTNDDTAMSLGRRRRRSWKLTPMHEYEYADAHNDCKPPIVLTGNLSKYTDEIHRWALQLLNGERTHHVKSTNQQYQIHSNCNTIAREGWRHSPRRARRACWFQSWTRSRCYAIAFVLISYFARLNAFNLRATNFYPCSHHTPLSIHTRGKITLKLQPSAPARDSNSYDFESIEEDILREQSTQPNNKSIRTNNRWKKKGKRKNKSTSVPIENPTAKQTTSNTAAASSRKKGKGRHHSSSKNDQPDLVQMPPWLAKYEDDNLEGALYLPEELTKSEITNANDNDYHLQRLRFALNGIFSQSPTVGATEQQRSNSKEAIPYAIPYFSPSEIHEIMDSIRVASHVNSKLMNGCADFLYLMLTLEEEGVLTNTDNLLNNNEGEVWNDDDVSVKDDDVWNNNIIRDVSEDEPDSIMTRDVLVAAAFHYCDCVRARKAGVYDFARQAMEASLDTGMISELEKKKQLWLPSAAEDDGAKDNNNGDMLTTPSSLEEQEESVGNAKTTSVVEDGKPVLVGSMERAEKRGLSPMEQYGNESLQIAAGAAKLKRAEIMTTIVNSKGASGSSPGNNRSQRNGDAEILRSFLVSLSGDWRALVIRSSACLYRLRGIVEEIEYSQDGTTLANGSVMLSTSTVNTARDAFRVYAPLAQRLGMQRLKTELENTAFRILYPRQYSVASSLYNGDIDDLKTIVQVLSSRMEQLLKSDQVFADQIEDVTVSSRVKEPYSLWKKLLRYRKENAAAAREASKHSDAERQFAPSTMSLKWVPDTIALRVVISGHRLSPLEDDESLRTREILLCYYAMQIISDAWPASTRNHAKDYIKNPKPNGYQSLHYTANLMISGEEWPFEVQVSASTFWCQSDVHKFSLMFAL